MQPVTAFNNRSQRIISPYRGSLTAAVPSGTLAAQTADVATLSEESRGPASVAAWPRVARGALLSVLAVGGVLTLIGCNAQPPSPTPTSNAAPNQAGPAVAPKPVDPTVVAKTFFKLDENSNLTKSPNGAHRLIANDKSLLVDGKKVVDGSGQDIVFADYSSNRIAAGINDKGEYIVSSVKGVLLNGNWVKAADGSNLMSQRYSLTTNSAAINNAGHWIVASEDGVVVDGKWAVDGGGQRIKINGQYDTSTPTWAEMGDDGGWAAGGSGGLVAGQVETPASTPAATTATAPHPGESH